MFLLDIMSYLTLFISSVDSIYEILIFNLGNL